jgi:hypothetical protein
MQIKPSVALFKVGDLIRSTDQVGTWEATVASVRPTPTATDGNCYVTHGAWVSYGAWNKKSPSKKLSARQLWSNHMTLIAN